MKVDEILSELAIDVARIKARLELERTRHHNELENIDDRLRSLHTTLDRIRAQLSEPVAR